MTRVARQIFAILVFAVAAGAEDRSPVPPSIRLTTLPNPVTDEVANGPRRAELNTGDDIESLSGVFAVRHPDSSIRYAWDPVGCRLMFCQRDTGLFFVADGPGPAAATIGAYGPPQFFGYRITEGGVPEFLYTQGRLGIEEQIRPGEDGKSLKQRFRIENADHGVILAVPRRWKDQVKSSAGTWKGDFLNLSKSDAKKGFTLTYELGKTPELPELPKSWDPSLLAAEPGPEPLNHGLPVYLKSAPGYRIEPFEIPGNQPIRSLAQLEDGGLLVATEGGEILIARESLVQPGDVSDLDWSVFSEMPLPGVSIRRFDGMPESVAVSHAYGSAQLFDTDKDGKADFFKALADSVSEEDLAETLSLPVDGWDVFELNLAESEGDSAGRLRFTPLGLNPDAPPSPPLDRHAIWIPQLICGAPSSPMFLEDGSAVPKLLLADQASSPEWRFARVFPDRSEGTLQGAIFDFQVAEFASQGLQKIVASSNGHALWGLPRDGSCLVRISPDDSAAFEVESIHLAPDAFEITFSQPVDRKAATDFSNFRIQSTNPLTPGPETSHPVEAAIVDSDGLTLALRISGLAPGALVEFNLLRLRSESGDLLSHGPVYYTANSIPNFPLPKMGPPDPVQPGNSTPASAEEAPGSTANAESSRDSKDDSEAP